MYTAAWLQAKRQAGRTSNAIHWELGVGWLCHLNTALYTYMLLKNEVIVLDLRQDSMFDR